MPEKQVDILIQVRGAADAAIRRTARLLQTTLSRAGNIARRAFAALSRQIFSLKGALAGLGLGLLAKSFVDVAAEMEGLQVRLTRLLGSVKEGTLLFRDLRKFAAQVPFEFREIAAAATNLAAVMEGGREEVNRYLPVVADLAAATGLTIEETTSQIIRMYSAGAASADLFRERGVLAMLGFQAGVSVSAAETRRRLIDAWEDPASRFRGAATDLADTWTGLMSMLADRWTDFRVTVMESGLFQFLKANLQVLLDTIQGLVETGQWDELAQTISDKVIGAIQGMARAVAAVVDTVRPMVPTFLRLNAAALDFIVILGDIAAEAGRAFAPILDALSGLSALATDVFGRDTRKLQEFTASLNENALSIELLSKEMAEGVDIAAKYNLTAAELAEIQEQVGVFTKLAKAEAEGLGPALKAQADALRRTADEWAANATSADAARQAVDAWFAAVDAVVQEQEQQAAIQQNIVTQALQGINDLQTAAAQALIQARTETANKIAELDQLMIQADQAMAEEAEKQQKRVQLALNGSAAAAGNFSQAFADAYELSGRKAKEFLVAQKAFAIIETIINTYSAAQKAYNSLAGVSVPLAVAAAAAATAAGLARVALISQQSFAEGGLVPGRSPNKKADDVPARLTAGEYVHPVDAVTYYGRGVMEAIRRRAIPREALHDFAMPSLSDRARHRFAEGGLVSRGREVVPPPMRQEPPNITNIIDPALMTQYVNSPAGEDDILNVISRRSFEVNRVLGR